MGTFLGFDYFPGRCDGRNHGQKVAMNQQWLADDVKFNFNFLNFECQIRKPYGNIGELMNGLQGKSQEWILVHIVLMDF